MGKAVQWDEERSELLSLLERLQDQLSAHAELTASARRGSRPPQRRAEPPPSPFSQPHFEGQGEQRGEAVAAADEQAPTAEPAAFAPASGRRGGRAASNLEASFDSVSGSAASDGASTASSKEEDVAGGSPTVAAHPLFDSPLPPESVARSGAPSPPSVRPPRPAAAEQQEDEEQPTPSSGPAAAAGSPAHAEEQCGQPVPHARSSASGSQTLEAFLSPPMGSSPVPEAAFTASAPPQAGAEQQRLQQAEQRAAELEVRGGGVLAVVFVLSVRL